MENLTNFKKDIQDCVFCGNCKTNCPTYKETSKESISARGRVALIRHLNQSLIKPTYELNKKIFSCLLCGACNLSCPLKIDITQSIYDARIELKKYTHKTKLLSVATSYLFKKTEYFFYLMRFFKFMNKLSHPLFKNLQSLFNISKLVSTIPLNKTLTLSKTINPIGRVALFPGCSTNYLVTQIGLDMIDILNALHYDVVIPIGVVCCGAPMLSMGLRDEVKNLAERNMEILNKLSIDTIISLCPTCVYTMDKTYQQIIGQGINKIVDSTTFIINQWDKIKSLCGDLHTAYIKSELVYHHPCHSKNYLNIKVDDPVNILFELGLNVTIDNNCCGFGGMFKFLEEELSLEIFKKKREAYSTKDMVITSCPNCIIQYRSGNINSKHFIEIIKNSMIPFKSDGY